jgi:hypothetical protein
MFPWMPLIFREKCEWQSKVPAIFWHQQSGAPRVRTAWTVLLVISTCKFCRGCAMHFTENGATDDRDYCVCITVTHRNKHRLLCSNFSQRKGSYCHHPVTVLSGSWSEWLLAVPYSENGQNCFADASSSIRIDEEVSVHAVRPLKVIR